MSISATKTEICNQALIAIGEDTVLNIENTDSKQAILCNAIYDDKLDAYLSSHFWNFALERKTLAVDATTPDFYFTYRFQVPADFLRLKAVFNNPEHKKEGTFILANDSVISILYVRRETNVSKFSSPFKEALAALLAMEMVINLTDEQSLFDRLEKKFKMKNSEAKFVDSTEGTPDELTADAWTNARL